ncbi:MAG: hypothetical protein Q9180_008468, partial [Flavoplaca navasiana]
MSSNIQAPNPRQMDPDNDDDGMDTDMATQRAALAKQRRSHKRTAGRKKSLLDQEGESRFFSSYCIISLFGFVLQSRRLSPRVNGWTMLKPSSPTDHPTLMMAQARRWLNNEQRKEDSGGITWQGFKELFAWTKAAAKASPGTSVTTRMSAEAEQAKERFCAELEAARMEQDRKHGVRDWWARAPSLFERTGVKRDKGWANLVAENDRVLEEELEEKFAHDVAVERDSSFGMEMGIGLENGAPNESVVEGAGLMDIGERRGHMAWSVTSEP